MKNDHDDGHDHDHDHEHGDSHSHGQVHAHDETRRIDTGHGIVELSIMEDGMPPHFWIAFEQNGRIVSPPDKEVFTVEIVRPDGSKQLFEFVNKGKYLESTQQIPEPHEFKARLSIAHGGHGHKYDLEYNETAQGHAAHKHEHEHQNTDHHDHGHVHGHHGHSHAPTSFGPAFLIGIILNTAFIFGEIIYGLKANSLALLADAGHNTSDVIGLVMAWTAVLLSKRGPTARFTYGLQGSSILAALANAIFLFVATGGIIWEAIQRLNHPEAVTGYTVIAVAAMGIAVNGFTAWLFVKGSKEDLNIRGAYLHMLSDAIVALGVVITGFVILQTHWLWLDPSVSIVIALVIIFGTWGLLRDSFSLALHAVPGHIDPIKVKEFLAKINGVKEVHDLHIWGMSTSETVMSVHLVMPKGHPGDKAIQKIAHEMKENFRIGHATIQIEVADEGADCALAPDNVI